VTEYTHRNVPNHPWPTDIAAGRTVSVGLGRL